MPFPFIAAITAAVKFVFTSQSLIASALRFIGGTILSNLLAGTQKTEGPRLADLKVQISSYGQALARLYGQSVRLAGNVIDKSDILETKKTKKKKMLGITVAKQTTYTYRAHLAIAICEGELPAAGLMRVFANGKVIFDRDAGSAGVSVNGGTRYGRATNTQAYCSSITFYPGSATQTVDETVAALHPGEDVPAYRHTAYVVFADMQLLDFGNGVPNIEFEVETNYTTVRQAVEHIASFADVTLNAWQLGDDALKGYIVGRAGTVWSAIEPLAGTFNFDVITDGADLRAAQRPRFMRTVLAVEDFAARPASDRPRDAIELSREDPNTYPDEVTVTYLDRDRDYQPNTQQAQRNQSYSQNKVDVEVAIVLDANEAREVAHRTLYESLAGSKAIKLYVSERFGWLKASNVIGVPIAGQVNAFRIGGVEKSPSGVIVISGVFEDPLSYTSDIPGDSGVIPENPLLLPGDSILQLIDGSIVETADDDTGFYFAMTGTGSGWVGGDIYRAEGVGSPLTYDLITDVGIPAVMADCLTTLASGPTDVWDWVNTLEVQLVNPSDTLSSSTEALVLERNHNFVWVGNADGEGEYINFVTATPGGSPESYTLSGLLRGRRGTEHFVGSHTSGERLVVMNTSEVNRMDFGPIDWNQARTYRAVSTYQDDDAATPFVFTNTGEGKRPYSPTHLTVTRNGSNDDLLLSWTRRTRYDTPAVGAGPVPLGEETEAYEIDILQGVTVVRTLTATTPSVNYTEAMQTADGHPLGGPVTFDVFQMSGTRGRGHVGQAVGA